VLTLRGYLGKIFMKWKILSLAFAAAAIAADALPGYSQGYVDDALRVSKPNLGGSTRTISLGGAFSSLGGDIGTLNSNPAGLGFFRRSTIAVTPQLNTSDVTSTYFFNKTPGQKTGRDYDIENVGIVVAHSSQDAEKGIATDNKLVGFAFGASYTRGNVFNTSTAFSGRNTGASFNSVLSNQADKYGINGQDYGSSLAGIAYDEYLINPLDKAQTRFAPVQAGASNQNGVVSQKGFSDITNVSFGANFGNVMYIGAGVNFNTINYERQTDFFETGYKDPAGMVDGLTYSKYTIQTGNGVNGKAGVILNLGNALHLGGYAESPTNYHMYESTNLGLWGLKSGSLVPPSVNYPGPSDKPVAGTYDPYVGSYNTFNIRTPWKFNGGASLILSSFALLTGEAEYIDYRSTRFSSGNSAEDNLTNSTIDAKYKAVINYKAGAELKFGPLSIRGGYAFYPSQYRNTSTDADRRIVSAGFGFRTGGFFIDFGGIKDFSRSYRTLYTLSDNSGPLLKQYNTMTGATITIGTRF